MTGPLQRALDSLADGRQVDWAALEASAPDAVARAQIRVFAAIAAIAQAHAGPERPPLPLPFAWGPLVVQQQVACGVHGSVYRAWDPRLEREVALKLLHAEPGRDAHSPAITEGRLLARVRHVNVVTVFGADRVDGRAGIWMEFLGGRTVRDRVEADGPCAWAEAIRIVSDVCAGLSAVHRAGLIHRDVKAQNVMLTTDGRAVLMDLGAAHSAAPALTPLQGTPLYLAPELLHARHQHHQ